MVSSLSHAGIGLLIVLLLGLRGRESKLVFLFSILPDLDFIPYVIFILLEKYLSSEMRNSLFYFMGHREFMHSILFIILVVLFLHIMEKNLRLTIACFLAILSHVYLDYATSWKMRPFFPFIRESSTLGAFDFFDPIVTVISLIPLFILLLQYQRNKGKWPKMDPVYRYLQHNKRTIIVSISCVFLIWCALAPFTKLMLVQHISDTEDSDISYQNMAPMSFGKFLGAYSFNETHYKIFETSYWKGIHRSDLIPVNSYDNITADDYGYISRAAALYDSSFPKEIDYPVYNITGNSTDAIVTVSDARSVYVKYWAYFNVEYTFIFDKENSGYVVFIKDHRNIKRSVPLNRFIDT
jgi:inner membrane protein